MSGIVIHNNANVQFALNLSASVQCTLALIYKMYFVAIASEHNIQLIYWYYSNVNNRLNSTISLLVHD